MIDLNTTCAGIKLKNPIVAASSGLTASIKKIKELEQAGVGAVVLKSLFEEQIEGYSAKMEKDFSSFPEADDYISTYVRMNHVGNYLNLIRDAKGECTIPIIASINCYHLDRWKDFAVQIEEAGADALELNIYSITMDLFDDDRLEKLYVEVVREVRKLISIPIVVKMSKSFSNIISLTSKLKAAGAAAVVLFNRYFQPDIDIENMKIIPGSIYSSPSEFNESLRWTAIVSGNIPNLDIVTSCGIHSWEGVVKSILAGANSVQVCSALYQDGFKFVSEIKDGLKEWMARHHFKTIEEFHAKLNASSVENPFVYERAQFMKYFSNHS